MIDGGIQLFKVERKLSYLFPPVGIHDHGMKILSRGSIPARNISSNPQQKNYKTFSKLPSN
jgi:hypothetical protein